MKYLICIWWYGGHEWDEHVSTGKGKNGIGWTTTITYCMRCGHVARE